LRNRRGPKIFNRSGVYYFTLKFPDYAAAAANDDDDDDDDEEEEEEEDDYFQRLVTCFSYF